jgi:hypothetical protein
MSENTFENEARIYNRLRNFLVDELKELGMDPVYKFENKSETELPLRFQNTSFGVSLTSSDHGRELINILSLGSLKELELLEEKWEQLMEDPDLKKLYFQELFEIDITESQKVLEDESDKENQTWLEAA